MNVKKILFIGAGASYGARSDHPIKLPLGNSLLEWMRTQIPLLLPVICKTEFTACTKFLDETGSILRDYKGDPKDFEKFISSLCQDHREVLHRALSTLFADLKECNYDNCFTQKKDLYDELIDKLKIKEEQDQWSIISLNYDVLMEHALSRAKINFHYPYIPFALEEKYESVSLKFFKPHGSINFFAVAGNTPIFFSYTDILLRQPIQPQNAMIDIKENSAGELSPTFPYAFARNDLLYYVSVPTATLIIANYAPGKGADTNHGILDKIRTKALNECLSANELIVIGVNPIFDKTDDPFCASLFENKFEKITYVSKDDDKANEVRRKLCSENLIYHKDGLDCFLKTL